MKQKVLTSLEKFKLLIEFLIISSILIFLNSNFTLKKQAPIKPQFESVYKFIESANLSNNSTKGLTIDTKLQKIVKSNLKKGVSTTTSKGGTAIVIEANSGIIKAISNINHSNATTILDETNNITQDSVIAPWEPGSVMKPLLVAAALNEKSVNLDTTFFDKNYVEIKGHIFTNPVYYPPQTRSVQDILSYSLNDGAIFLLKSLGNGSINKMAQNIWYSYLTEHYNFGHKTGIELPGEASGEVRPPSGGRFIETQYAGSAFGVGVTVTPLQLTLAYASIINGGSLYKPILLKDQASRPVIIKHDVVSPALSKTMQKMLEATLAINNPGAKRKGYVIGGKSGTAPVAGEDGAYKIGTDNGTYIGFIGKEKPKYVVLVRLDEPVTQNFASFEAKKIWAQISNQLIDQDLIE